VWVRHEQQGVDGPLYDHHLMLGVEDEDWATGDLWALELGMRVPPLQVDEPTWEDLFPLSDAETLRAFGTVIWEHDPTTATGDDPLDYRHTWEPFEADPAALERFTGLVPEVDRVEATLQRLWKGDVQQDSGVCLYIGAPDGFRLLSAVVDAARESGLVEQCAAQLGLPQDPRIVTATIYEART